MQGSRSIDPLEVDISAVCGVLVAQFPLAVFNGNDAVMRGNVLLSGGLLIVDDVFGVPSDRNFLPSGQRVLFVGRERALLFRNKNRDFLLIATEPHFQLLTAGNRRPRLRSVHPNLSALGRQFPDVPRMVLFLYLFQRQGGVFRQAEQFLAQIHPQFVLPAFRKFHLPEALLTVD